MWIPLVCWSIVILCSILSYFVLSYFICILPHVFQLMLLFYFMPSHIMLNICYCILYYVATLLYPAPLCSALPYSFRLWAILLIYSSSLQDISILLPYCYLHLASSALPHSTLILHAYVLRVSYCAHAEHLLLYPEPYARIALFCAVLLGCPLFFSVLLSWITLSLGYPSDSSSLQDVSISSLYL